MLLSTSTTLSTTAALVATGQNSRHTVLLTPSDATVLVGGAGAQSFPLPDPTINPAPVCIRLSPGETLYAKSSSGTPSLKILHTGLHATP